MPTNRLYTLGHSTRPWPEFLELLSTYSIRQLADVRRFPGSRRHPHFGAENLATNLPPAGVAYLPFISLGGRRKARPDSPNLAWRNESFRGYADYMMTGEFHDALAELERVARKKRTAIMCSELLPWRCHRSLIADAMVARGWTVIDVMTPTSEKSHALPSWARVAGTEVTYPGDPGLFASTA